MSQGDKTAAIVAIGYKIIAITTTTIIVAATTYKVHNLNKSNFSSFMYAFDCSKQAAFTQVSN